MWTLFLPGLCPHHSPNILEGCHDFLIDLKGFPGSFLIPEIGSFNYSVSPVYARFGYAQIRERAPFFMAKIPYVRAQKSRERANFIHKSFKSAAKTLLPGACGADQ